MTEKPYHHGDLRAVAKRAGVSHAAPAHHFGDTNGLLTALAAEGFTRFQDTLDAREVGASDARDRAVRAGLGYLEFAIARPALFRLIFSSARPDYASTDLQAAADRAYVHLLGLVQALGGGEADVLALWATSHGIADLASGQKLRTMAGKSPEDREAIIRSVLLRCLPGAG